MSLECVANGCTRLEGSISTCAQHHFVWMFDSGVSQEEGKLSKADWYEPDYYASQLGHPCNCEAGKHCPKLHRLD